jgi:hypothetical protein
MLKRIALKKKDVGLSYLMTEIDNQSDTFSAMERLVKT